MADELRRLLRRHEGSRSYCYEDTLGYLTIGVGHLVDKRKGGSIPEHIIDALLDYDLEAQRAELVAELPGIAELDEVRQAALLDMEFSLKFEGLASFPLLMLAIHKKDWDEAARQIINSKWATQVGRRGGEIAAMIATGKWPMELQ